VKIDLEKLRKLLKCREPQLLLERFLSMCSDPDFESASAEGRQRPWRELQIEGEVRFIGRPPDADKPVLYALARALLYPTLYEGFGLPALEAMASGTPVVGGNASSVAEVVGNAGMLVDPLDARAMAGAVIAVCIQDDLHERLRRRAVLRAAEFSWQRTAYESLAVMKAIVTGTPSTSSGAPRTSG